MPLNRPGKPLFRFVAGTEFLPASFFIALEVAGGGFSVRFRPVDVLLAILNT
jgi:hypothetical protein